MLFFIEKHLYAELYERIGIAVDTQNSGDGALTAKTRGPCGNQCETEVDREEEGSYTVSFTPDHIGEYRTNVYWNNNEIQGSPFVVWVGCPVFGFPSIFAYLQPQRLLLIKCSRTQMYGKHLWGEQKSNNLLRKL